MMNIKYIEDKSIFDSRAKVLVNTVNCKGAMGKGLAKEFATRYPECLPPYKLACDKGQLKPGGVMLIRLDVQPDFFEKRPSVLLFATKDHWRRPSHIEWIKLGLKKITENYRKWNIESLALPQLGCGLGGLNWDEVRPLIEEILGKTKMDIEVYINTPPKSLFSGCQ